MADKDLVKHSVACTIRTSEKDWLKDKARRDRRSISGVIQILIRDEMDREKKAQAGGEQA